MPGLPRKSTKNKFTKLLKKSGKSKTNTKSGATAVTKNISTIEKRILNFENFINENKMESEKEKNNKCDSQEHDRLVAWYGRCIHCKGTKMKNKKQNNSK